ncbi:MAG TPA: zincin-like metallopeptidase domain-containing protein [Allosphingosinicella sp.]|nr:zincin-like metallopeptidase domain-containing protein [Allosphingosinicella sp.]
MDIPSRTDPDTKTRTDVYRTITDKIIAAIERGAGTWIMPWHGSNLARPQNACTGNDYHGVNVLALWAEACLARYTTGWWATYKQWQQAGGQVRRDEKASTIVFFKQLDRDEADGEADGEDGDNRRIRLVARASRVFNADQVDGWEPPVRLYPYGSASAILSVQTLVHACGANIRHGGNEACYRIPEDLIEMPPIDAFVGTLTSSATEAYAATLLHEHVHWTGARHRLDRGFGDAFDKKSYAAEELVAEIGAAYLCADLGVSNEPRPDHAAYVAHWLELLKDDPKAIFIASRLADKAATYLHDLAAAP